LLTIANTQTLKLIEDNETDVKKHRKNNFTEISKNFVELAK